jgi:hypothetical protein
MRALTVCLSMLFLPLTLVQSQVFAPAEIRDDRARELQQKYFPQLKSFANEVKGHNFPYHFYFSRVLDISERQEQMTDQRAIQFDEFHGKLILKVTGNYFAAYSAESMQREQRARQTFTDVMIPIIQAAVPQFKNSDAPDEYAFEISHHVRKKVLGVWTEGRENVVLVLPKKSAEDLAAGAGDLRRENAALLNATAFLDGKSLAFWPTPEQSVDAANQQSETAAAVTKPVPAPKLPAAISVVSVSANVPAPGASLSLDKLNEQYRPDLDRMVRELDSSAHFVAYAAPGFIEFHKGRYLQLSLTSTVSDTPVGSQYQLAALSFDKHIAHLIRPVLSYLKSTNDFDGIDFSTSVHIPSDSRPESKLAVEYLFPLAELRKYEDYDCTGQQLLDAGYVLINGERVGLNLQTAEK